MGKPGREAGSLRKALLVVVMVAASFAGGAVVNGPGLARVRGLLGLDPVKVGPLESPAPGLAPPLVEVSDDAPPAEESASPLPAPQPAPAVAEAVTVATPAPAPAESKPDTESGTSSETTAPRPLDLGNTPPPLEPPASASMTAAPSQPNPNLSVEPGWGDAPGSAPATAFLPEPRGTKPRIDPAVTPASLPRPAPTPAPAATEAPKAAPTSPEPVKPDSPGPVAGWPALQKRMTALGVSRYWIEGEPAGAVRFRCVVPLAGGGAIAQQFEAEADDMQAAAEAALRRIDLWRATENLPQP